MLFSTCFSLSFIAVLAATAPERTLKKQVFVWKVFKISLVGHFLAQRKKEQKSDTFPIFCRKLLRVARRYPSAAGLIPSMAKRVQAVLKHGGAMTKY